MTEISCDGCRGMCKECWEDKEISLRCPCTTCLIKTICKMGCDRYEEYATKERV